MGAMFDIFTTHQDDRPMLLDSVSCQAEAEDMAHRLSLLFPGESFAYFERLMVPSSWSHSSTLATEWTSFRS
jgi:hypothetical protein